ncbi:ArsR/SmtB family transcription factor [Olsenella uli]|uniref:ArsR/SmtB family transcription factor n=1 Tax=Olsenella uli TaxID=133926 RepID=UPI001C9DD0CE|nr:metalloregulator ArsR/SmtB family transcription factor [Olsenella uli]
MQRSTNRKCAPAASETNNTIGHADLTARKMSELGQEFAMCRDAFIALGDESRQLIFMQLLQNYGGMRVGELTNTVGLSRPTVSHHLKILKDAGLVSMYSVGTKNFYHASSNLAKWRQIAHLAKQAERFVEDYLKSCDQGTIPPYRAE